MAKKSFEDIVAWNGTNDTGEQARAKIKRNFDKVNDAIDEIMAAKVGSGILKGMSLRWDLNLGPIPTGFALNDGNNGVKINGVTIPDDRGSFAIGYDPAKFSIPIIDTTGIENYGKVGNTGGANTLNLSIDQLPAHSFKLVAKAHDSNHAAEDHPDEFLQMDSNNRSGNNDYKLQVGTTEPTLCKTDTVGKGLAIDNRPLYITVCWITKVSDDVEGGGGSGIESIVAGTNVEVDNTDPKNPKINVTVSQGEKGDKGDTGDQGEKGDKGDKGDAGSNGSSTELAEYVLSGLDQDIKTGMIVSETVREQHTITAASIYAEVTTAPASLDIVFDIKKNGVSIFSTLPKISAGTLVIAGTQILSSTTTTFNVGDIRTIFVNQVGLSESGKNLVTSILMNKIQELT